MIDGDSSTALKDPYSVVLTESTARKYFNNDNAVGKSITIREGPIDVALLVKGVVRDVPENAHFSFDFLISHATLRVMWGERADQSWDEALFYTYIQVEPSADHQALTNKLTPELLRQYSNWDSSVKLEFVVQPLRDIYLTAHMVQEAKVNGDAGQISLLWLIALLIVLLSWINYINISTARYLERAKEVGVRKIIGARRYQLLMQFIIESGMMALFSMALACILVQTLLPFITTFTGKHIPMWDDLTSLLGIAAFFIAGSLLSAVFPALILSSLNTVNVLKGKLRSSAIGVAFRKGLIVFQFVTAALIIGGTFIVYLQLNFMRTSDIGADISQTIILPTPDITDSTFRHKADFFKAQLLKNKNIAWAVSSTSIPGKQDNIVAGGLSKLEGADKDGINHYSFGVDRSFIDAYKMKIVAGRNFASTGDNESVILNETAMRMIGFDKAEDAIGQKIAANWTPTATIIGIVEDFHQHSLRSGIDPVVLFLDESAVYGYYSIKINATNTSLQQVLNDIENEWQRDFAGNPFDYFFLDDYFNDQYKADIRFGKVLSAFSLLGLVIACLGIFGLSIFNASQRTKEIGIRKVLGATIANILVLLSWDYLKLIVVAMAIAIPLIYFAGDEWLSKYTYRIDVQWWMLILPAISILLVAILTISSQSVKAAMSDPARSLNN
jgi:putative ABC transport system permease protein